uniref:Ribosomal protein S7 n=1 Tax=Neogoniolithon spectabile TaxID=231755 RepID=A0A3G3MGS9_9FLOR|nr:ribosomal protein S7 [Neogoniolithon spectabile]AYR06011.1 ribosomal protein S7 [Neogoniolithon spectabile]
MSRRKIAKKRMITQDPVYGSRLITMLSIRILKHGKKSLAQKIIYQTLDIIKDRTTGDPMETIEKAIRNSTPLVEVKAKRVGGSTYQVPMEIRAYRGTNLALRWLIQFARRRQGKNMPHKLASEIIDASNDSGNTIKKKRRNTPYG